MAARLLLLANAAAIVTYVLWQGLERFCWEAYGTWLLSPLISIRIFPPPLKHWCLYAANSGPLFGLFVCVIPVAMAIVSLALGARACRLGSLPAALIACSLMTAVFVVYHSVKHMGIHLVIF